jgi:starch phosphorylase
MKATKSFIVIPSLPKELAALKKLSYNFWWTWDPESLELYRRLERDLWEKVYHNPIGLLGRIQQEKLKEAKQDEAFCNHLEKVVERLDAYLKGEAWFQRVHGTKNSVGIAYFSLEYGFHESLPIYSGGLGILAADHLKSASDLGIPIIGIGLLYRRGYFHQRIDTDGWQQEIYNEIDYYQLPIQRIEDQKGNPIQIELEFPQGKAGVHIWRLDVGRIQLYFLDTSFTSNPPWAREITQHLYGGDQDMRIRQEIVLGIGGIRALKALGLSPNIFHMNEGHSSFLCLERIRALVEEDRLSFSEAVEVVSAGNIFTTHTSVPAGNDIFTQDMIFRYFDNFVNKLGISRKEFLAMGRQNPADEKEMFSMTVLALKLSARSNGVSKLHRTVSQKLWKNVWPNVPVDEIPIDSITNGMHARTWISYDMAELFDKYLGPRWIADPPDTEVWERIDKIPPLEVWKTHERRRERLVTFVRQMIIEDGLNKALTSSQIKAMEDVLNPEALTLGMARRFATYKRLTLIFQNIERLKGILSNSKYPVQIVLAGKAHPRDTLGKQMIKELLNSIKDPQLQPRVVFIEDYDLNIARYLVQGCDVWLNIPRKPLEASGTSGMKANVNGVLNISIPDGWWCEAEREHTGWTIGLGEEYTDHKYQDQVEANKLYDILEKEVIPLFYDRGRDGLPNLWIARMKNAIKKIGPVFNTHRMVKEYLEKKYIPASEDVRSLQKNNYQKAKQLAQWKQKVQAKWNLVKIESINETDTSLSTSLRVGSKLPVEVVVNLGGLSPDDVSVEIYTGNVNVDGEIIDGRPIKLEMKKEAQGYPRGYYCFCGYITCETSGHLGYSVRVLPYHPDMINRFEPGLVVWG